MSDKNNARPKQRDGRPPWYQWLLVGLFAVVAGAFGFWVSLQVGAPQDPPVLRLDGQLQPPSQSVLFTKRPNFVMADLQGAEHSADQWLGSPVVLNFWATWCGPCRAEMPQFAEFAKAHPDVVVVGAAADDVDAARRFVIELGIEYLILAGPDTIDLSRKYGNRHGVLPYTAIIDATGLIAYVHSGVLTAKELATLIEPLRVQKS